jgi:4-hydroxy-tetrahydrodipicolinate reductase
MIAADLDKLLRKHGVTYFGTGDSTTEHRVIMAFVEKCTELHTIRFSTHGGLEGASQAAQRSWGIGLTPEEYERHIKEGSIARLPTPEQELLMISERLGWQLDEIREKIEPFLGEDGRAIGTTMIHEGIKDGKIKIEKIVEIRPNTKHFCRIDIEGSPSLSVVINCVEETTIGPLVNAIPYVINAPPGIVNMFDAPLSSFFD